MSTNLFETAISYKNSGLDIIPVHPVQKYPVGIANWETKIFNESELEEYIVGKNYGIGIRNQEGLDFDNHPEKPAIQVFEKWKEIVNMLSPNLMNKLLIEKTQHEGFHVTWKCEVKETSQKLAMFQVEGKTYTAIESKGVGGLLVVSPTTGYSLIQGDWCNLSIITPTEREILFQVARSLNETPDVTSGEYTYKQGDGNRVGDIFNRDGGNEALSLLIENGWTNIGNKNEITFLRRPNKTNGVSATFGHIASSIFYNFSSNASPFEPNRAYSPFAVLALLKFNGNFSETAFYLAERYGVKSDQNTKTNQKIPYPNPVSGEALVGLAGEVVNTISPHSEADQMALLLNFLTGFGSIIGDHAYFKIEADKHPMRLFSVLVGESSRGRKGTSWGYVKQLLSSIDPDWGKRVISGGLSSGEGLIWAVRDEIYKKVPIKEKGHTTGYEEILEDQGISDKRLLIVESELASTLRVLGREGNILSALIRNAWDTGNLQTLTKNSPAKATGAHISIIGHVTKEELLKYLTSTETSNGFGNRFMWACVKRSKHLPYGGGEVNLTSIIHKLESIIEFSKSADEIIWSEAAKNVWAELYGDLSEEESGLVGAMTARAEAYVTRLSSIYCLLDRKTNIQISHLKSAVAVWDYIRASTEFIFKNRSGDPIGNRIIEALSSKSEGMTRTDFYNFFGKNTPSEQISTSLDSLEKIGRIRSQDISPEGRSKSLFTLNTYQYADKRYLQKLNQYINKYESEHKNDTNINVNNVISEWQCPKCNTSKLIKMQTVGGANVEVCAVCPPPIHLLPIEPVQPNLI